MSSKWLQKAGSRRWGGSKEEYAVLAKNLVFHFVSNSIIMAFLVISQAGLFLSEPKEMISSWECAVILEQYFQYILNFVLLKRCGICLS